MIIKILYFDYHCCYNDLLKRVNILDTLENNVQVESTELLENNKSSNDFKINWVTVIVSILFSLVFSLASLAIYSKFITPKVYTIKIDEILADHIKTIGSANLTDEQKQNMAEKWSLAFDQSIKDIYAEKNVVLTQQAVVIGGTDYTAELKKEIALKLDSKNGIK